MGEKNLNMRGKPKKAKGSGAAEEGLKGGGRREEVLSPASRWRVSGLGATLNPTWISEGPLAFLKPTRVCSPDVTRSYGTLPFMHVGALQTAGIHCPVSGS